MRRMLEEEEEEEEQNTLYIYICLSMQLMIDGRRTLSMMQYRMRIIG
jgi:hypothetical protein